MKRRVATIVGALILAGSVVYVARPAGHQPPYDANLVRLAESRLEGYCAGQAFWASGGDPAGNASLAAQCRAERAGTMPSTTNLAAVPRGFCRAIVDSGWEGTAKQCLEILGQYQYWPTYDGGISNAWNRARPYPLAHLSTGPSQASDESRTGGRGSVVRPTHERVERE